MALVRGIVIRPAKTAQATTLESSLDALQGIIGGYIENLMLSARGKRRLDVYMNEDGVRLHLTPNRITPTGYLLRGVLLVLAANTETGEMESMTDEEITETLDAVAGWTRIE